MEKTCNLFWRTSEMKSIRSTLIYSFLLTTFVLLPACTKHDINIKPVEIKPIHITIDINVKVDRALDDFFGDLDNTQAE